MLVDILVSITSYLSIGIQYCPLAGFEDFKSTSFWPHIFNAAVMDADRITAKALLRIQVLRLKSLKLLSKYLSDMSIEAGP